MLRLAFLRVGIGAAVVCGSSEISRAEDTIAIVDNSPEETAQELSNIADAHAQITAVLPPTPAPAPNAKRFGELLAYAGIDGWRYGGSAYSGVEWSPSAPSGFMLRVFGAHGIDDFRTDVFTYRSETTRASVLPGYHFQSGKLDVKLFVGGDFMMRRPLRPAIEAPVQVFGARASIDVWSEPTPNMMFSASVSGTTIEQGASGRLASGWRLPFAWIGPELLATRDIYNTQMRAGAHLSGLKVGITEWSVAGGYSRDSFGRDGGYGRIGVTLRP